MIMFRMWLLLMLCCSSLHAQPRWLQDMLDTLTIPVVDREASTLTLLNDIDVEFLPKGNVTIHVRVVTKVLQPSGVNFARFTETVSQEREMADLEGWLITAQGRVTDLEDENIVELSTSGFEAQYHTHKTIAAGFPNVKMGDIVAYEYEIRDKDEYSTFQRLQLQRQQPAYHIRVQVVVPEGWSLHASTWRMDPFREGRVDNKAFWIATNLPYEPNEPMTPSFDYLTREIHISASAPAEVEGHSFKNWESVARWCSSMLENSVEVDLELRTLTQGLVPAGSTQVDQIRAVARFVSTDVRYVAVAIEKGRWIPRTAPVTLRNRYGDCKDKTILMRAMLQSLGIASSSVLLNTRVVVDSSLPTPFQFNHCIIGIPSRYLREKDTNSSPASRWVFYDPTDMNTAFGLVPQVLQGNRVLVVQDSNSELIKIPRGTPELNTTRYRGSFSLREDGSIAGKVVIADIGLAAGDERYKHRVVERQRLVEGWTTSMRSTIKDVTISNFQTADMEDSVLTSFEVTAPTYLASVGDSYMLKVNPFNSTDTSPLVKEKRHHPIWFGQPSVYDMIVRWEVPRRWKVMIEATQIQSECAGANVFCSVTSADTTIVYSCINRQTGVVMYPNDYASAKRFRGELSAARNITLFLRKP